MNKAKQCVAIAKDVIKQLNAGMYDTSEKFTYLKINDILPPNRDLQSYFGGGKTATGKKRKPKPCYVCAKGALFVSYVRKYDGVKAKDIRVDVVDGVHEESIVEPLLSCFSEEQLDLIETAYEGLYDWRRKYPGRTDRLRAIAQNIIDNKGTFVP